MPRKKQFRSRLQDPSKFTDAHREQLIRGHDFFGDAFGDEIEAMRAAWKEHRAEILAEYVSANPGRRPWAFWQFDAPEPRRQVGGPTECSGCHMVDDGAFFFGLPQHWTGPADFPAFLAPLMPDKDVPLYESQAAYLKRHKLLSDAESEELNHGAFRPVRVGPWGGGK